MKKIEDLKKIKGVGEVLSKRLVGAGYDTYAKIAAAGSEGLKKIVGMNPKLIESIIIQAEEESSESHESRDQIVEELKQLTATLKWQAREVVASACERSKEKASGKTSRKIDKELIKVISSLEKVEEAVENREKKAGKGLIKAGKRLSGLTEAGLKDMGKGLKKIRKSLNKIIA